MGLFSSNKVDYETYVQGLVEICSKMRRTRDAISDRLDKFGDKQKAIESNIQRSFDNVREDLDHMQRQTTERPYTDLNFGAQLIGALEKLLGSGTEVTPYSLQEQIDHIRAYLGIDYTAERECPGSGEIIMSELATIPKPPRPPQTRVSSKPRAAKKPLAQQS